MKKVGGFFAWDVASIPIEEDVSIDCGWLRKVAMLQKKKGPKPKKSIVEMLMRDMQGTAAEKLSLFEKLRAAGGFAKVSPAELRKVERMLQTLAVAEQKK
jgi:hypothetical protein